MERTACVDMLVSSAKRLKISTPTSQTCRAVQRRWSHNDQLSSTTRQRHTAPALPLQITRSATQLVTANETKPERNLNDVRLPKNVQAVFLAPLRRAPTHGIPVCDLQIRSYSVRNLEAFTDFCMRAAYYLNLPARGPVPLPRITERWTVPRSNFVHKKSQENFERITLRRLIQIQDGHPETVAIWLAYIQRQRYYGVGMKANIFEQGKLDVVEDMDQEGERISKMLGEEWNLFGEQSSQKFDQRRLSGVDEEATKTNEAIAQQRERFEKRELQRPAEAYSEELLEEPFKAQWGSYAGLGSLESQPTGRRRFRRHSYRAGRADNAAFAAAPAPATNETSKP